MQPQAQVVDFVPPRQEGVPPVHVEAVVNAQHQKGELVLPPARGHNPGVQFPPGTLPGQQPVAAVAKNLDPVELVNILLRFLTVVFLFLGTVIVGATKYEESANVYGIHIYTYRLNSFSTIKYFLAANSIVLIYTVGTLVISVASILVKKQPQQPGGDVTTLRNKLITLFVLGDLLMVVFLFSAAGAAAGSKDMVNTKSDFSLFIPYQFCDELKYTYRDDFCGKWTAGIAMSMLGAIAYLVLELLSVFSLTKLNQPMSNA